MKKSRKNKSTIRTIPKIPVSIASKYAGKTAAIVHGKVVAGGQNTQEAIINALKKFPKIKEWNIGIMSIPPRDGVWVV
jgi:hypothetical protein